MSLRIHRAEAVLRVPKRLQGRPEPIKGTRVLTTAEAIAQMKQYAEGNTHEVIPPATVGLLVAEIERLAKEREKHLRAMRLQHDEKERMRAVVDAARGFSDVPLPDEFAALRAALAALDRQD